MQSKVTILYLQQTKNGHTCFVAFTILLPLMKKFGGKRPLDEILKNAKKKGFAIDTTQYSEGRDYIWFAIKYESDILSTGYNTFNGQFLGTYGDTEFTSNDTAHDNEPRMNMLFDLFYLPPKEENPGV